MPRNYAYKIVLVSPLQHKMYLWLNMKLTVFFFKILTRFIVREFTYNEEELNAGKNELNKLAADKKKQYVSTKSLDDLFANCFPS